MHVKYVVSKFSAKREILQLKKAKKMLNCDYSFI